MITAILEQKLDDVGYRKHSIFGTDIPMTCPGVPSEVLSPARRGKTTRVSIKKPMHCVPSLNRISSNFLPMPMRRSCWEVHRKI